MTPKLPEPAYFRVIPPQFYKDEQSVQRYYTADQMREMWKQGMERAAKVCDGLAARDKLSNYYKVAARAIRKEITS